MMHVQQSSLTSTRQCARHVHLVADYSYHDSWLRVHKNKMPSFFFYSCRSWIVHCTVHNSSSMSSSLSVFSYPSNYTILFHSPTLTASFDIHKVEFKNVLINLRANGRLLTIHHHTSRCEGWQLRQCICTQWCNIKLHASHLCCS